MISFATLSNQRLVIPSSTGRYYAVDVHYFIECHRPMVETIKFDAGYYRSRYDDIAAALENGTIASEHSHYVTRGYYENRMPYGIDVDEAWYLQTYQDVHRAVDEELYSSAQQHFDAVGFAEGRLPFPNFTLSVIAR